MTIHDHSSLLSGFFGCLAFLLSSMDRFLLRNISDCFLMHYILLFFRLCVKKRRKIFTNFAGGRFPGRLSYIFYFPRRV